MVDTVGNWWWAKTKTSSYKKLPRGKTLSQDINITAKLAVA